MPGLSHSHGSFSVSGEAVARTEHLQVFERVLVLWWWWWWWVLVTRTPSKVELPIPLHSWCRKGAQ